ncbi:tumor necrosis factor alpha-induced protein 2-like [Bufo bufo]|uniref:tumor necrosis factor alpha-induced protein 2-like n=1 Tax=Bufo bufo TaxID=8384 RepID=UPI001ABEAC15|nr:tumor necrosis factor alpha-induced protein 2-like [Bufo bufo]
MERSQYQPKIRNQCPSPSAFTVVFQYMKKIKSTMAAVAQLATMEQITGKKRHSTDDGQKKKKGIIKGIVKALSPNKYIGHHKEPGEIKKEPTAEDIEEQIEKKQLLEASNNLIDLERKILKDPLLHDKTEELKALYEKLEKAVFRVIQDSITETNGDLLSQAVNAIVAQETEDAQDGPDHEINNSLRPTQWKRKWKEYIRLSVFDRIGNLSEASAKDSSSSLSQSFLTVGKTFKQDLVHVITHLKEHYPKDFDVCNTYALYYHRFLASKIDLVTDFQLGDEDTYYLLCFVHNYYPIMILKDPIVAKHIDDSDLHNLVPSDILMQLEGSYFTNEIESVKTYLNRCLDMAVDRWKSGKEPEILGNRHHSELHIDIVQIYNGAIKRAKEIKKEIAENISCLLPYEMKEIFKRYKTSLEEFLEKNKTHSFFREIGIANLNCCFHFREFIERKDTKFDLGTQQQMLSTIVQCEDLIYAALLQELFLELKAHFKKMSQSSSLCSHQAMQDIVKIAERYLSRFSTLCPLCYKDMVARIHKHLVKEYLIRILKRKVSHKNALQLQTLAAQIKENASLISEFCAAHKSEEEWLKPVIPKVAEIIRLQDLSAIQLEVATLVGDYPDIRNKQIEAILYIKGNLSRQDIKSILKVADTIERDTNSKPKLFELLNS